MKIRYIILFFISYLFLNGQQLSGLEIMNMRKQLAIQYKGNSQIEVGGSFTGIEFHKGVPLPQRVSFFSPVANSIDNSTDYWFRDTTHILDLKLKVNKNPYKTIASQTWKYELTPYRVEFCSEEPDLQVEISYEFCKTISAFVIKYNVTNKTTTDNEYSLRTNLSSGLRTCHSYDLVSPSKSFYTDDGSTSINYYEDVKTQFSALFITNAGEIPCYDSSKTLNAVQPFIGFKYVKTLAPGESLNIIQIIGSSDKNNADNTIAYLKDNYQKEIDDLEQYILNKTFNEFQFRTNEKSIDHTYEWAKAVLISNTHYIDQDTVLMPCPAEYNFFFTHDMLVTDLSRVNYDIKRVEKDLLFIQKHSNKENVIPHAYYWKDSSYVTEYSELDNWNHLWFVILCGKYLKHSNNIDLLKSLYPLIQKSIEITLGNKKEDDLMWASRPDGWDIGNSYGPRSFMTILAIKALREYVYVSTRIGENTIKLYEYESLSNRMQMQLNTKLWNENKKYLINYYINDSLDTHYYIGSLLAAHFNLIGEKKKEQIIESVKQNLLDKKLGVYNVYPMDFHLLQDFLKFKGNEVGQPYLYANGGIWSHANAWYLLNLTASNKKEEAYEFLKNIMTLDGIINSPNGQPAMYEYRCSNHHDNSVYGKVDKPQFSWAASWYIYSLYHLYGIKDNDWNINLDPWLKKGQSKITYDIVINNTPVEVTLEGHGEYISSIKYNDVEKYSLVIGSEADNINSINVKLGEMISPYITETTSVLESCDYKEENNLFQIRLKSFAGHEGFVKILSGIVPVKVYQGEKNIIETASINKLQDVYEIKVPYKHNNESEIIKLQF